MGALRTLLDLLLPRRCLSCGGAVDSAASVHLCAACLARLPPPAPHPCPVCGADLGPHASPEGCRPCRRLRPRFDGVLAAGRYEGLLRELVVRMKYGRDAALAWALGEWLAESLLLWPRVAEAEVVAPVPTSWRRRAARGFDPAALLAADAARRLDLPLRRALRRVRPAPVQAGRSRTDRLAGPRGTMAARPRAVAGRAVLLVDDVLTTGATASEAARALKAAGARAVLVGVAARA